MVTKVRREKQRGGIQGPAEKKSMKKPKQDDQVNCIKRRDSRLLRKSSSAELIVQCSRNNV